MITTLVNWFQQAETSRNQMASRRHLIKSSEPMLCASDGGTFISFKDQR
jgi:hypothetical protein